MASTLLMRVALLAAVLALVCAQTPVEDTTGKSVSVATDYTFNSNVGGYLKLSEDMCVIKQRLAAGDYAGAQDIYEKGRSDYVTSEAQRTLRGVATGLHADEPTWSLYNNYFKARGQTDFLNSYVEAALAGTPPFTTTRQRVESAEKGIQNGVQTVYLLHELDEAAAKIADGNLDATTGAPNNVDETFAIYVGKDIDCSPWGTAEKRALEFGTRATCSRSAINQAMVSQFTAARAAAIAGNAAAFAAAQNEIKRQLVITHLQNAIKYSALVDEDLAANRATDENQAEGYAFFRTIEPLAAAANANATAVIVRLLTPGAPVAAGIGAQVKTAVNQIASALKITQAELGTFGATQNLNCPTNGAAPLGSSVAVAGAAAAAVVLACML